MMVKAERIDIQKLFKAYEKTYSIATAENIDGIEEKYYTARRKTIVEALLRASTNPKIILNPYTDSSFWDYRRNYINIGILPYIHKVNPEEKIVSLQELALSLFAHEISHENHSTIPENVPYPFSLLNILEDERIERLAQKKWGSDFRKMHELSFEIYYKPMEAETVFNPYNLIILHRWCRWSEKIKKELADYLKKIAQETFITLPIDPQILPDYVSDIEKVLDDATNSESTEKLIQNTIWFYEKWKELFEKDAEKGIAMGIGHGTGTDAGDLEEGQGQEGSCSGDGKGESESCERAKKLSKEAKEFIEEELERLSEDEEVERDWDLYDEYTQTSEGGYFTFSPRWKLDRGLVEYLKKQLKKIRWTSRQTQVERTMLGRKPDAKRVENLLPNPMKRRREKVDVHMPKVLFVIDGSGSMDGYPYKNAVHLAVAFMETFKDKVSVVVTLDNGNYFPVKSVDQLLRYRCNGGRECLNSTQKLLSHFDLTIYFTDACVRSSDERFLRKIKSDNVVGMLTTLRVERAREWLPKHFKKVVIARDLKGLVKELSFLMKRQK